MSTELYLIAHKVRGEPAFDIAQHLTCPKCEGTDDHCSACDGAGHWWVIPTSGHRAWPYWSQPLHKTYVLNKDITQWENVTTLPEEMPPLLRDHYTTEREAVIDLTRTLGLEAKPTAPIVRRF